VIINSLCLSNSIAKAFYINKPQFFVKSLFIYIYIVLYSFIYVDIHM